MMGGNSEFKSQERPMPSEREEIIELIRNEYDPCPDLGRASYPALASEWDDGAGRVADAILADRVLLQRSERRRYVSVMKEARINLVSCINMITKMGHGDTCNDLRDAVAKIDALIGCEDDPVLGRERAMEAAGIAT
jgi:hypothetical protein